ncbi:hypothetical protein BDF20DRAFT_867039 [Mycotypha africana]|uniref:uncharacterized protein n=1 Tax=Mycotypha africana TaxID=64632 RepID=UPI002300FB67|nr:uncharacterized protein BDF20DRAFT_867039 [Mycotypha africana]KAI8982451.1 hypothetical protein BDF20DRAFT_867039 [Mycotypha africana]
MTGTLLLGHRLFVKGHRLFDINISQGCFRPKPIDCMLTFIIIFNALRLLSSTILIADIGPDMISRAFMYEFPWQFGFGAFALYLIGIARTLADSHRVIANSWLPSPRLVDFIGGTIFLAPFIINNVMSLAAGILAERDLGLAQTFTRLLYIMWFIHCSGLSIAVFFSGYRLIRILEEHLEKFKATGPRYVSVKTGIFKIRLVMSIIVTCLLMFAVFLLVFGILRETIIIDTIGSIVLGGIWNFLGAVATLGVEFAIIFNPKIDESNSLGLKSSSAEKSTSQTDQYAIYSNFSPQEYSAVGSNNGKQAEGGGNNTAFDELKLQQLQYQKVFQKHNNHLLPHNSPESRISQIQQQRHADTPAFSDAANQAITPKNSFTNTCVFTEEKTSDASPDDKHLFQYSRHQSHHLDDERVFDDGENSQMDLVEYVAKY